MRDYGLPPVSGTRTRFDPDSFREVPKKGSEKKVKERTSSLGRETVPVGDLDGMSPDELWTLMGRIKEKLPSVALDKLKLDEELIYQLERAKSLQGRVSVDEGVPANQQAQVLNSVVSTIQLIAKLQAEVYTTERLKAVEASMIECLKVLPMDAQTQFIEVYKRELDKLSGKK